MFVMKLLSMVVLAAPFALALTVNTPSGWRSATPENITWTATSSDPSFSIELNHPSFNNKIAIANNINAALQELQVTLPVVPAQDQYTIEFVNISNVNQDYAVSGQFRIDENLSSSTSLSTSSGATTNSASSPSNAAGTSSTNQATSAAGTTTGTGAVASPTQFGSTGGAAVLTPNSAMGFAVMAGAALVGAQFLGI